MYNYLAAYMLHSTYICGEKGNGKYVHVFHLSPPNSLRENWKVTAARRELHLPQSPAQQRQFRYNCFLSAFWEIRQEKDSSLPVGLGIVRLYFKFKVDTSYKTSSDTQTKADSQIVTAV